MSLARRVDSIDLSDPKTAREGAGDFGARYPTLADFILLQVWPDSGEKRASGNLMLFVQDGAVKARLIDNDSHEVAWVTAGTLADVLDRVEAMLSEGRGDWRPDRQSGGKKRA
jgi:hypothetical protein